MALVLGTNCGFVETAPTTDPEGGGISFDKAALAGRYTTPSGGNIKITEIGWYNENATEAADFDVAIYTDDTDLPKDVIGTIHIDNAKGTGSGWKVISGLDITLSPSTKYWIGISLADTATATNCDQAATGGEGLERTLFEGNDLTDPWSGGSSFSSTVRLVGIYALFEDAPAPPGFTRKIKIAGTFQDKPIKEKKAGTFQDKPISIKVGGTFQDA